MGSLVSAPKAPPKPVVQYVAIPSAPVTTISSVPSESASTSPASSAAASDPTDEQVQERAREESLLERRRGRLSTILTSFRGLLNDTMNAAPRKTLLGE